MIDVLDAAHPQSPLLRQTLARHRLYLVDVELRRRTDLRLAEDVVDFLRRRILPTPGTRHQLGALLVDAAARPLAHTLPYQGYLRGRQIDPRAFLAPGLLLGAAGLILFHYRPARRSTLSRKHRQMARWLRDQLAAGAKLEDFALDDDD